MKGTMKGLIKPAAQPGAEYRTDLPIPDIRENEVLVKVNRTAICGTDIHIYNWTEYARKRIRPPMVFGHEFAGVITELGARVSGYEVGQRVAGETHIPCNACVQCRTGNAHICEEMKILGVHTPGSFAEYIAVPVDCLWAIDDAIDDDTGAMLEPMGVAVHGVLSGDMSGLSCACLGCGPIGAMGVAAAKACGAAVVYATDRFASKLELGRKMGADHLINTAEQDPVEYILGDTGGAGVDVVVDFTGVNAAIREGFRMLKKGGRFTFVGLPNGDISLDAGDGIIYKEARINGITGRLMYKTWYQCAALLGSGRVDIRPVIGGVYPLAEYGKAFESLAEGAPGKMILIP